MDPTLGPQNQRIKDTLIQAAWPEGEVTPLESWNIAEFLQCMDQEDVVTRRWSESTGVIKHPNPYGPLFEPVVAGRLSDVYFKPLKYRNHLGWTKPATDSSQ